MTYLRPTDLKLVQPKGGTSADAKLVSYPCVSAWMARCRMAAELSHCPHTYIKEKQFLFNAETIIRVIHKHLSERLNCRMDTRVVKTNNKWSGRFFRPRKISSFRIITILLLLNNSSYMFFFVIHVYILCNVYICL